MSRCLILSKSPEIDDWTAIFHRVYGRDPQISRLTLNQQTEALFNPWGFIFKHIDVCTT